MWSHKVLRVWSITTKPSRNPLFIQWLLCDRHVLFSTGNCVTYFDYQSFARNDTSKLPSWKKIYSKSLINLYTQQIIFRYIFPIKTGLLLLLRNFNLGTLTCNLFPVTTDLKGYKIWQLGKNTIVGEFTHAIYSWETRNID